MEWAYGVTTCASRLNGVLPATLRSLANGGFPKPRLFIDGRKDPIELYDLPVTCRWPAVYTSANWIMGLAELVIRQPFADRYAMFQDDVACCKNMRQYLETWQWQPKTFLSCYTFFMDEDRLREKGFGWHHSCQLGRGALAYVFDRYTALRFVGTEYMWKRFDNPIRGFKALDGGVVCALGTEGYSELCHFPSLTQHTGMTTSIGPVEVTLRGGTPYTVPGNIIKHQSIYWPGEAWDPATGPAPPENRPAVASGPPQ